MLLRIDDDWIVNSFGHYVVFCLIFLFSSPFPSEDASGLSLVQQYSKNGTDSDTEEEDAVLLSTGLQWP